MNTPTPRDVERMLQSMADQEPPDGLLEQLEAGVPEVLPTSASSVRPEPRILPWNRNRVLVAALGLAAAIAVGFGMALFLQSPQLPSPSTGVVAQPIPPTPTAEPQPTATVLGPGPHPSQGPEVDRTTRSPKTPASPRHARAVPTSSVEASAVQASAAASRLETRPSPTPALRRPGLLGKATDGRDPLPGVTIGAVGPSQPGSRTVVSGIDGRYDFGELKPGDYRVQFELQGFETAEKHVRVGQGAPVVLDVTMPMSKVREEISVVGEVRGNVAGEFTEEVSVAGPSSGDGYGEFKEEVTVVRTDSEFSTHADQLVVIEAEGEPGDGEEGYEVEDLEGRAGLLASDADGETLGELPLKHTGVTADIAGFMARTVVTQEYVNTFTEPIEAVYVFPLGAMAAVNDFVMEVGDHRIIGVVRPREEAERIYQEARERGQTASLLTQERPNIFTQNVANIAPGGTVTITITTFETLTHDRGTFEYVFPMVVGPRYIPGGALPATSPAVGGGGWSAPTTVVPDADRITPPVLKPGERSGHDIDLTVHLDAGLPITDVRSVAHRVDISEHGTTRRTIKLAEAGTIPNRDFVLRWTVAGERLQTGVLTYRDRGEGYLALLVQPPLDPADAKVSAREITFVLDVSGSMDGVPVETSNALVRRVLDSLRPADAFNIFVFAGEDGQLWEEPHAWSPENVAAAKEFLTSLEGSGGTEMLAGLKRAITGTHDPARLQMFVFCTDGDVGDEDEILAFIQQERGDARFFAFGIGSSVNRYLIDGIGRLGGGASMVVVPQEAGAADRAAERFFSLIDAPVLVDAAIDWNGLPVIDSYPERLGDLFTGGAFTVVARFTRPAAGIAYLTGRLGTRTVRFPIVLVLPRNAPDHAELAPVWARRRIADLSEVMLTASKDEAAKLKQAITDLAIEYRLASPFTSFVAVDEAEVRGTGRPKRVQQPVPMPQDVRYEGVFGKPR
jgi:Ca-activated chloride channel homolog